MSLKIIPYLNRDNSVGAVLGNRTDIAVYNERQVGVTFLVTRFDLVIPNAVRSLPDFRRIGELQDVIGKKVAWFTVNRTRNEVLNAFEG